MCPPLVEVEEEEVISAAACLKREKGEMDACLPPTVPRGASVSAAALLQDMKGRNEGMFFFC